MWYTTIIPALRRMRQKDPEFEASLGYVAGCGGASQAMWDSEIRKVMVPGQSGVQSHLNGKKAGHVGGHMSPQLRREA
jgi:hypothetical protein